MPKRIRASEENPEVTKHRKDENDLFVQNFRLIYDNVELILNTAEYFFCEFGSAYLTLFYIGGGKIPLGVLLLLWKDGKLKDICPSCGNDIFIYGAGGSPLSGSFSWWGICEDCHKRMQYEGIGFFWGALYSKMKEYRYEDVTDIGEKPIFEKIQMPGFSEAQGADDSKAPDKISKATITGISLKDLIEILKSK